MTGIIRRLVVNGAEYAQESPPRPLPGQRMYTARVFRGDEVVPVYSRYPHGPFVFTVPLPNGDQS